MTHPNSSDSLQSCVVTAEQMTQIENRIFAAGMPVAALMEKVAGLLARRIQQLLPTPQRIGILAGPGHNGGDALVIARELHLKGYEVLVYQPFERLKELTQHHAQYAASLGIPFVSQVEQLDDCQGLIDGLFGFGLTRPLEGAIADTICHLNTHFNSHFNTHFNSNFNSHLNSHLNSLSRLILSIDLPSGIHTDTGAVLGSAIQASHTFCLGLWKRAFLQDVALPYLGASELVPFGIPLSDVTAVLGESPELQRITAATAIAHLPLHRSPLTHKYDQGHLLLVCGSRQYPGAALLAGMAARASGVGMLSIAVPESLRSLIMSHIPDSLVLGCAEGAAGEIAHLPEDIDLNRYDAIACGCGLTPRAERVVQQVLASDRSLILDADGLNCLANLAAVMTLQQRQAPTILTPHPGEFKRIFFPIADDRIAAAQQAAQHSGAIVLLKGARTAIAHPSSAVRMVAESSPALARGGSGDVLTGVMGGLLAQGMRRGTDVFEVVNSAAWWHAQAGIAASRDRTALGVDASTLVQYLISTVKEQVVKAV